MKSGSKDKQHKRTWSFHLPGRYMLYIVTVVCIGLIVLTYNTNIISDTSNVFVSYIIVPFQNGVSLAGGKITSVAKHFQDIKVLQQENARLQQQNEELLTQNTKLEENQYELNELRQLYKLDDEYNGYEKVGARVIARDPGNYYHNFIINKGTRDGLSVDMNVLAGAGLAGRIVEIGSNWARVDTIIDDNSNVSASVLSTSDNMIVSGSLELYAKGQISFSRLNDPDREIQIGQKVVTSNISDKYLPGMLIGYINSIENDSNNLTRSGTITPAVDFSHINTVLVIRQLKEQPLTDSDSANTNE